MVHISPAVPELVLGDRYRIEHVIGNFLSNAIKFSPEDSEITLDVSVEAEQGEIDHIICCHLLLYKTSKLIIVSFFCGGRRPYMECDPIECARFRARYLST